MAHSDSFTLSANTIMSKQTYRFLLRPLDKVFFGGEKSPFIDEDYYLRSHFMPQQTTLLGFLRYWLLLKGGLLQDAQRKGWTELIGQQSFSGNPSQSFGAIQRLSPLRIAQLGDRAEVLDDYYMGERESSLSVQQVSSKVKIALGDGNIYDQSFALFKEGDYAFDGKNQGLRGDFKPGFWNLQKGYLGICAPAESAPTLMEDGVSQSTTVFLKATKPGITKNYGGESKEDGYFKTEYYRMQPQFAYSFLVELEVDLLPKSFAEPGFCRFGGDGGSVAVTVLPEPSAWDRTDAKGDVFFLLSDTLVDADLYQYCAATRVKVVHFRNLRTQNSDTNFSRRPRMWYHSQSDPQHSNSGKIMLQKGSLLIAKPGQAEKLQQCLQQPAYYKIGYNHFIRLNQLP